MGGGGERRRRPEGRLSEDSRNGFDEGIEPQGTVNVRGYFLAFSVFSPASTQPEMPTDMCLMFL